MIASMSNTKRKAHIREQMDRNKRMRRVPKNKKCAVFREAASVFRCNSCATDILMRWETVNKYDGMPVCRECGSKLILKVACLTEGVLPKIS